MSALSASEIFEIATELIKSNLLNIFTTNPFALSDLLTDLSNKRLPEVLNKTSLIKENFLKFVNETLPCILNITTTYKNASSTDLADGINRYCFHNNEDEVPQTICAAQDMNAAVRGVMFMASVIFLLIMSCCCYKRQRCRRDMCSGRPGPVVPLNMLDSYENRIGFALAFGITVASCVSVLFGDYADVLGTKAAKNISELPGYVSTFIKMFLAIFVAMLSYPFFVCQTMRNKLTGGIVGLLFCLFMLMLEAFKLSIVYSSCAEVFASLRVKGAQIFLIFIDVPKYICLILLLIKFAYSIYKTTQSRRKQKQLVGEVVDMISNDDTNWKKEYIYIHVKDVFIKHKQKKNDNEEKEEELSFKEKMKMKLYKVHPGFKYSTRIIATTVVSSIAVYLVNKIAMPSRLSKKFVWKFVSTFIQKESFSAFLSMHKTTSSVMKMLLLLGIFVGYALFIQYWDDIFGSELIESLASLTGYSIDEIKDYGNCMKVSWWIAIFFGILFYLLILLNSLSWYRKHILMLRRGDRSFLPNSVKKGSLDPVSLAASSLKFAGYQVGYCAWGYIIMVIIAFILFLLISTQVFLPMKTGRLSFFYSKLIQIWPSILIGIVMMVAQKLLSKHCFLIDEETMAINNRFVWGSSEKFALGTVNKIRMEIRIYFHTESVFLCIHFFCDKNDEVLLGILCMHNNTSFDMKIDRKAFHITSYILFYFNIFLGLVSCLLRIVYGVICGVLFLQRLQKSSLPRSYEKQDPGFLTYIGFILLEHQHANPSLQCFARLLLETQGKQLSNDDVAPIKHYEISHNSVSEYPLEEGDQNYDGKRKRFWRKRAEIRWHLFLLLSQNPSLIKYRKRNLPKKKPPKIAKMLFGCLDEETVIHEKTKKYELFENEDSTSDTGSAKDSHLLDQQRYETDNPEADNHDADNHDTDNHDTDNHETENLEINKNALNDIDNITYM